jgi:hypothetical protein
MKKNLFLVLLLLVVFAGLTYFNMNKNTIVSYVKVSINPEVQLGLNADGEVVEVLPLNEDADLLVEGLELEGLPVEEAMEQLIDETIDTGFIDEYTEDNAILVEVVNDDEEERETLEEDVMANLKARLEEKRVYAVLAAVKLGEQLAVEAEEYGISRGKMMLVEQALVLNPELVKDELVLKSVKEIQEYIREAVRTRREALNLERETLRQEKEALKEEHKAEIEALKEQAKTRIENFNNLDEEGKEEAIKEQLNKVKDEARARFEQIKEKAKAYLDEEEYDSLDRDGIPAIREIIRRKGN